jgi:hypothetical protein
MAATIPSGGRPAGTPRRTRRPDRATDVVLVISVVLAAWALGLAALTAVGILQPTYYLTDQKAALKALGATVVAVLALSQTWSMESAMGHLPRRSVRMRTLMRAHRWGGRIAIALAALVAFFCMVDIGAPREPTRVAIHVLFAASAFTVLATKLALIRFRPTVAYAIAPWLGRYVALAFIVVWVSSAFAYFSGDL